MKDKTNNSNNSSDPIDNFSYYDLPSVKLQEIIISFQFIIKRIIYKVLKKK